MNCVKDIEIGNYTYDLPDEKIAKYPKKNRDEAKLLILKNGKLSEDVFKNISAVVSAQQLIVRNNTKVIQARLLFHKQSGARIEIFCLKPKYPADFAMNFQETEKCVWECTVGNLKKWKNGVLEKTIKVNDCELKIKATKIARNEKYVDVEFSWNNSAVSFSEILESIGQTPIPPYLSRKSETSDKIRYQTVYSKHKGSVAAPTAGLHFSDEVINLLKNKGIRFVDLTLHVGAGTFVPVKSAKIGEHNMHTELFFVNRDLLHALLCNLGKIIAVGTTTVRTLESLYWLGVKIIKNPNIKPTHLKITQWGVYESETDISPKTALTALLAYLDKHKREYFQSETQIIIVPGYKFRFVNAMFTNFHQPQSTLLLLIAAFVGNKWKELYEYALKNNFRFLSYGDSSFLVPDASVFV